MSSIAPIWRTRDVQISVVQCRDIDGARARTQTFTVAVPLDDVGEETATLMIRHDRGSLPAITLPVEMPWADLQSAASVDLVLDEAGRFSAAEIKEYEEPHDPLADTSTRNAPIPPAPVVPNVVVNVEPTPIVVNNEIVVQDDPAPSRVKFKRRKDGTIDEAIITTEEDD